MPCLSRRRLLFFLPMAEKGCCRETDIGMNHCISGHAKTSRNPKAGAPVTASGRALKDLREVFVCFDCFSRLRKKDRTGGSDIPVFHGWAPAGCASRFFRSFRFSMGIVGKGGKSFPLVLQCFFPAGKNFNLYIRQMGEHIYHRIPGVPGGVDLAGGPFGV